MNTTNLLKGMGCRMSAAAVGAFIATCVLLDNPQAVRREVNVLLRNVLLWAIKFVPNTKGVHRQQES